MPKKPTVIKSDYSEIDDIRADLNSLKDNVVELTKHLKQDSVEQVEEIGAVAKEKVEELQTRTQVEMKKLESQVKKNPMQSVGLAFAGGILASLLLRR